MDSLFASGWLATTTPTAAAAAAAAAAGRVGRFDRFLPVLGESGDPETEIVWTIRIGRRRIHISRGILVRAFNIKLRIHIGNNRIVVKMLPIKQDKPQRPLEMLDSTWDGWLDRLSAPSRSSSASLLVL